MPSLTELVPSLAECERLLNILEQESLRGEVVLDKTFRGYLNEYGNPGTDLVVRANTAAEAMVVERTAKLCADLNRTRTLLRAAAKLLDVCSDSPEAIRQILNELGE